MTKKTRLVVLTVHLEVDAKSTLSPADIESEAVTWLSSFNPDVIADHAIAVVKR